MKATQEINADGVTNSQIFINKFEASTTYGDEGGLNVTKTLNGRTLAADMFDFTITGEATDSVTAEEAEAKLAETDKSFKNTAPGKDDVAVMSKLSDVKFDETDIGKTYQYSVRRRQAPIQSIRMIKYQRPLQLRYRRKTESCIR